jgi:hypothetical protein
VTEDGEPASFAVNGGEKQLLTDAACAGGSGTVYVAFRSLPRVLAYTYVRTHVRQLSFAGGVRVERPARHTILYNDCSALAPSGWDKESVLGDPSFLVGRRAVGRHFPRGIARRRSHVTAEHRYGGRS